MPANPRSFLVYCRPGFEREAASELVEQASMIGLDGEASAEEGQGFVSWQGQGVNPRRMQELRFDQLIFARQLLQAYDCLTLPEQDRLSPLLAAIAEIPDKFSDVVFEGPDTNDGKALSGFFKRFQPKLIESLQAAKRLAEPSKAAPRLHLFWLDKQHCLPALSYLHNRSEWPMGIPRLKMPHEAPSRSTLKLVEALHTLMSDNELRERMRAGQRAVDLGAAPGGWTWQLVNRGLKVIAVDNGPLKGSLVDDPLVQHLREDGLRYRPRKAVDWVVCDMVEKPSRIAQLIAGWLADGAARQAIFNLKLPMKKRYDEAHRCFAIIDDILDRAGLSYILRAKQLYHDREEITCFLAKK